jgi:hypothetical protein
MYPEREDNGGQQGNDCTATPLPPRLVPGSPFIPEFARRRPIRAVLLAAAVFAIPYSLARHQGDLNVPRLEANSPRIEPITPAPTASVPGAPPRLSAAPPVNTGLSNVAIESAPGDGSSSSSATAWRPPIGVDRTNETLDQLTMDFTSGPQPARPPAAPGDAAPGNAAPGIAASGDPGQISSPPQTPGQPSGFQAGARFSARLRNAAPPAPSPVQAPAPTPAAAPAAAPAAVPADVATVPTDAPQKPRTAKAGPLDGVDQYLWSVYQRSATKRDSSGDFTWKDEAAAARLGLVTKQYVIGGMDPDFRELLYNLGHDMDAAGLHWTILSGFRDDYRQGLASGYKAHVGNSFHGGSRATGGYGHGCAADIEASDGEAASNNAIWHFVDQHGEKYGIFRPMKQIDPAHIQPSGGWHDVAFNLREKRQTAEAGFLTASVDHADADKITPLVDTPSGVTEAQFDCVRSHRHGDFRLAGLSHHRMHRAMMFHRGGMHRFGRRRMVDAGSADRRTVAEAMMIADRLADAETSDVKAADVKAADVKADGVTIAGAGSAEKRAKADAPARNRRDSGRNRVTERPDQHPGKDAAKRAAKAPDAKEQKAAAKHADDKHADDKHADDKRADRRHVDDKRAESRHANDNRPQKHAATDTAARQAKAKGSPKSRLADHADASGKDSSKKL